MTSTFGPLPRRTPERGEPIGRGLLLGVDHEPRLEVIGTADGLGNNRIMHHARQY